MNNYYLLLIFIQITNGIFIGMENYGKIKLPEPNDIGKRRQGNGFTLLERMNEINQMILKGDEVVPKAPGNSVEIDGSVDTVAGLERQMKFLRITIQEQKEKIERLEKKERDLGDSIDISILKTENDGLKETNQRLRNRIEENERTVKEHGTKLSQANQKNMVLRRKNLDLTKQLKNSEMEMRLLWEEIREFKKELKEKESDFNDVSKETKKEKTSLIGHGLRKAISDQD